MKLFASNKSCFLVFVICFNAVNVCFGCFSFFSKTPTTPGDLNYVSCSSSRQINSNGSLLEKIVGGSNAAVGQYPWQVYIQSEAPNSNKFYACGATLISNQWLVTAAHCFMSGYTSTAYLGDYSLKKSDGETKIIVSKFIKVNFIYILAVLFK